MHIKDIPWDKKKIYEAEEFDVAVVGAGHAGCEAALAAARLGYSTVLFTLNMDSVANLPCNPNIGGTSKGQLVREVDALGGEMGKAADATFIQSRMLNTSRGPAVLSPRAQIDRRAYQAYMKEVLEQQDKLHLHQGEVTDLVYENIGLQSGGSKNSADEAGKDPADKNLAGKSLSIENLAEKNTLDKGSADKKICGLITRNGAFHRAKTVIVTTGTFMEARIFVGPVSYSGGPDGLFPSKGLSDSIKEMGMEILRFKTGTPVRINMKEVDTSGLEEQKGDDLPCLFSHENENHVLDFAKKDQKSCFVTWTTEETKSLVLDNLDRSPLYSGDIESSGPRYCPSVEDKFVKFPQHKRHQVFIEPTGADTDEMYLQGMSSSMPEDLQIKMLRSLPGLENCRIMRTGYAIEYDLINPMELYHSLEHKKVSGLFFAGQVNGSSGYEEAAGQGLVAGVNAVALLEKREPLILDRSLAYIGVLIDDLVTKGTAEPYRMMTSRAEYRLVLRQDNADERLTEIGYELGLISEERYAAFKEKMAQIDREIHRFKKTVLKPDEKLNHLLDSLGSSRVKTGVTLQALLKRPEIKYADLAPVDEDRPTLPLPVTFAVEVKIKYEGYIVLENERIEKFRKMESKLLPKDIDYQALSGLRMEARQQLEKVKPYSLGQASRLYGVSPADIAVLLIYLDLYGKNKEEEA